MKTTTLALATPAPAYRTIWISDVHLGTPGCNATALASFLKHTPCEHLYLVGDIIDGWSLSSRFYWPQEHSDVIRRVLTKAKRGTSVTYVAGNHDEFLRKYLAFDLSMGNIRVVSEACHVTADGRRLLVTHGDQFDVITRYHRWLALTGDAIYNGTMTLSRVLNRIRSRLGMDYWSLADFAKRHVKSAINIVSDFERSVVHECKRRGFDGVVCGHIHHAEVRDVGGITYHNCGDWVDSCTALAEDYNGHVRILRASDAFAPEQHADEGSLRAA